MARIAYLTTNLAGAQHPDYGQQIEGQYAQLRGPFRERRWDLAAVPWDGDPPWDRFDAVLPLCAWGYHRRLDAFQARMRAAERAGCRVLNPYSTLAWNADKGYLLELAGAGVDIVPSRLERGVSVEGLLQACATFETEELVVKPRIGAGAFCTYRVGRRALEAGRIDWIDALAGTELLVQPFVPTILEEGEYSFIALGGRFSHVVRKVPAPGDFRVQHEFGGAIMSVAPSPQDLAAAGAVLAALIHPWTYARVDMVRSPDGRLRLMELELIEPFLYLEHGLGAVEACVDAVLGALTRETGR